MDQERSDHSSPIANTIPTQSSTSGQKTGASKPRADFDYESDQQLDRPTITEPYQATTTSQILRTSPNHPPSPDYEANPTKRIKKRQTSYSSYSEEESQPLPRRDYIGHPMDPNATNAFTGNRYIDDQTRYNNDRTNQRETIRSLREDTPARGNTTRDPPRSTLKANSPPTDPTSARDLWATYHNQQMGESNIDSTTIVQAAALVKTPLTTRNWRSWFQYWNQNLRVHRGVWQDLIFGNVKFTLA
jgi:hypothetical protein